ncbi:hypothetical protein AAHC03_0951 [Spirometra sp. Aus1]
MNMPVDENGMVHFTTTLFALIRESLGIKIGPTEVMDQRDNELRYCLCRLWPVQAKRMLNILIPPDSELTYYKMTVGKIYAGLLILENHRLEKQPQCKDQSKSADLLARFFGGVVHASHRSPRNSETEDDSNTAPRWRSPLKMLSSSRQEEPGVTKTAADKAANDRNRKLNVLLMKRSQKPTETTNLRPATPRVEPSPVTASDANRGGLSSCEDALEYSENATNTSACSQPQPPHDKRQPNISSACRHRIAEDSGPSYQGHFSSGEKRPHALSIDATFGQSFSSPTEEDTSTSFDPPAAKRIILSDVTRLEEGPIAGTQMVRRHLNDGRWSFRTSSDWRSTRISNLDKPPRVTENPSSHGLLFQTQSKSDFPQQSYYFSPPCHTIYQTAERDIPRRAARRSERTAFSDQSPFLDSRLQYEPLHLHQDETLDVGESANSSFEYGNPRICVEAESDAMFSGVQYPADFPPMIQSSSSLTRFADSSAVIEDMRSQRSRLPRGEEMPIERRNVQIINFPKLERSPTSSDDLSNHLETTGDTAGEESFYKTSGGFYMSGQQNIQDSLDAPTRSKTNLPYADRGVLTLPPDFVSRSRPHPLPSVTASSQSYVCNAMTDSLLPSESHLPSVARHTSRLNRRNTSDTRESVVQTANALSGSQQFHAQPRFPPPDPHYVNNPSCNGPVLVSEINRYMLPRINIGSPNNFDPSLNRSLDSIPLRTRVFQQPQTASLQSHLGIKQRPIRKMFKSPHNEYS